MLVCVLDYQLFIVAGIDMIQSILIAYFAIQLKKILNLQK
jgi:hypothetical protein